MTALSPAYSQGDIVVVDFPFTDVSQTQKRPALVLSNQTVNQTGDYLLVMITSQVKYDGLSLPITPTDYLNSPLPLTSFIRVHKISCSTNRLSHTGSQRSLLRYGKPYPVSWLN